jgi:tRNA (cmo5U34)-methyltransferase
LSIQVSKFGLSRAGEYEAQSRIALAGYEACHELAARVLRASLQGRREARILVVGAGGGALEVRSAARLGPAWSFVAVDPSEPMMDIARLRVHNAGLAERTSFHVGYVDDLPRAHMFDAATLIGVLHHIPGYDAKHSLLASIAARLHPGAPFILAGNRFKYDSRPLSLAAWAERWRLHGAGEKEVRAKQAKIRHGAEPPAGEKAIATLLDAAGFGSPELFFSSLFWGAWFARRLA